MFPITELLIDLNDTAVCMCVCVCVCVCVFTCVCPEVNSLWSDLHAGPILLGLALILLNRGYAAELLRNVCVHVVGSIAVQSKQQLC